MGTSTTCGVCGTVNVNVGVSGGGASAGRCIACGQPISAPDPAAGVPPEPTVAIDVPPGAPAPAMTVPIDTTHAASPQRPTAPGPPPAPQPATEPVRRRSATGEVAASAARRTIVEPSSPKPSGVPAEPSEEVYAGLEVEPGGTFAGAPAGRAAAATPAGEGYVVRLLLPEGDKRLAEVGRHPVRLGSGLDELGLAGDPRVRSAEAVLFVADGHLWLETLPDATGIYRRIDGEETLRDGDVILMGDVAAEFRNLPAGPAPVADLHVLGGSSAPAAGRLLFLRRDGSPGPVHDLPVGRTIVGRTDGHVNFPQDSRLSRRHVRFNATEGRVTAEDLDSRNGTYVRVRGRRALDVGDALRVGSAGVQIRSRG